MKIVKSFIVLFFCAVVFVGFKNSDEKKVTNNNKIHKSKKWTTLH